MSLRCLRILLSAAVVLAAGSVQAQVPTMPYTTPPLAPPAGNYYYGPTPPMPPSVSNWALSVVDEAGASRIQLQTADGSRATVERLTVHVNGCEPAHLTIAGKQLTVRCGEEVKHGDVPNGLQGKADRMSRSGPDGSVLTLEGNATLRWTRQGKRAEFSCDRISINLANGHVEGDLGTQPSAVPAPVCPITPCLSPTTMPAVSGYAR